MRESGIDDYGEKGQRTKERKRQEKQQEEEELNKKALKIQKVFRGKQSRKKPENSPYDIERVKRFVKPNPDYDPTITNPYDPRSQKELYFIPKVTTNEGKIIAVNKKI